MILDDASGTWYLHDDESITEVQLVDGQLSTTDKVKATYFMYKRRS